MAGFPQQSKNRGERGSREWLEKGLEKGLKMGPLGEWGEKTTIALKRKEKRILKELKRKGNEG